MKSSAKLFDSVFGFHRIFQISVHNNNIMFIWGWYFLEWLYTKYTYLHRIVCFHCVVKIWHVVDSINSFTRVYHHTLHIQLISDSNWKYIHFENMYKDCEAQGLTRFLMRPPPYHHPQLKIKSKQVYTSPTPAYDTFLESLGQDLSNPTYVGLICWVFSTQHP